MLRYDQLESVNVEVSSPRILLLNKILALAIFDGPTQSGFDQLSQQMQADEGEVYTSLSNARGWQVKLLERVNFIKSFSTNVNVVCKKKPGRLPEEQTNCFQRPL